MDTGGKGAAGSLRIYSRRNGAEIKIISGDDAAPGDDAELFRIEWFDSPEDARAVAANCGGRLVEAKMPADEEGWHQLATVHVQTLINVARAHLRVTFYPERPTPAKRTTWSLVRFGQACYWAGRGLTHKEIAGHPNVASTPNMVRKVLSKGGVALRDTPQGQVTVRLPLATTLALDRMAAIEGLTREAYLRKEIIKAVAGIGDKDAA